MSFAGTKSWCRASPQFESWRYPVGLEVEEQVRSSGLILLAGVVDVGGVPLMSSRFVYLCATLDSETPLIPGVLKRNVLFVRIAQL